MKIFFLKTRYLFLSLLFSIAYEAAIAQQISFKDTLATYNLHKTRINKTGLKILGSWGLVNITAGGIGYVTSTQNETKYFSEMSMAWGVVNTGIAALSLINVRREMAANLGYEGAYRSYKASKKLYLINAGLDVVYIGVGLGLAGYSQNTRLTKTDQSMYSGFGKSVVIQGVFLLLFDNFMFSAHQLDNSKWYRIMNEIRFTNKTVGFNYSF